MKEELSEKLYSSYPELFGDDKKRIPLEVGDGWYVVLDVLFKAVCDGYRRAKENSDNNTDSDLTSMLKEEEQFLLNALPNLVQVKEKFGSLRVYARTTVAAHKHYIEYAEMMSSSICESCGRTGSIKTDNGWMNCRCSTCRKAAEETHFHG